MEQFIIDCVKSLDCTYIKINDESDILIIHDLLRYNIIGDKYNSIICLYYGLYYENLIKDYDLMKKYYLMAINYNNIYAMNNLAHYYQFEEKHYDLAKKYYLMAINNNHGIAMYNLGCYYQDIEENHDLMKKYYLMAADSGDDDGDSLNNLGYYYQYTKKDYDLMKKYYLMSINDNNVNAIHNLAHYYQYVEINYDLMNKYYLMGAKNNNDICFLKCLKFYNTTSQRHIFIVIISYNNNYYQLFIFKWFRYQH